MESLIKPGDVVTTFAIGPKMTVEFVSESGRVSVAWFDWEKHLHRAVVDATSLRHADAEGERARPSNPNRAPA